MDQNKPNQESSNPNQQGKPQQQNWDKNDPKQQQGGQQQGGKQDDKKSQQPEHNVHDQERKRA